MRKLFLPLLFLAAYYLDSVFFSHVSLFGAKPDMLMASLVCMAILLGGMQAGFVGAVLGLLIDLLSSPVLGVSSIGYILASAVAGFFYQKFYADNVIVPAATAAGCCILKLHVEALAAALQGAHIQYWLSLPAYILPCALLTGLAAMPLFLLMRYGADEQIRLRASSYHE